MLTATRPLPADRRLTLRAALPRVGESDGLLVLVLAAYAAALLLTATGTAPDTWFALVGGREVTHGLPSVDHLTILAAGVRWVDQQWLAQLILYGAYAAGGLLAVVLLSATSAATAIVGAAAVARWRGADMRATVWIAAAAMIPYLLPAEVPRSQTLALPLFVGVVCLLIRDSLRPSRHVLLTLPLLALWANLHGSVLLAVSLVALHGILILRGRHRRFVGSALVVGSIGSIFATPYATGLPHYYSSTLLNPSFKLLTEWGPTTFKLETLPLFVLLFVAVFLIGRAGHLFTATEFLVLFVTAGAALHANRFTVWFALAAVMILPRPLTRILEAQTPPANLNRLCARLGMAAVVVLTAFVVLRGIPGYPEAASAAAASAAGDQSSVFASELYGDWLLLESPSLAGRMAYDSRISLLPTSTVSRIQLGLTTGLGWPDLARDYRVFVLNTSHNAHLIRNLADAGYSLRYRHGSLVVLARN